MEKVGAYTDRVTESGEWRSGNPASGQQATPMLAGYFNMMQRELVAVVEEAGIELDKDDDGQLLQAIQRLRGGAGTGFGHWAWSAGTAGDPGAGKVALNNANPALATQVMLAEVSAEGADYSMVLSAAQAGDTLYLQPREGAALGHRFKVTGAAVDNGSYRTIPVAYITGSGGLPAANTAMLVRLVQTTAADPSTEGIAGSVSNLKASTTGTNATVTVTADSVCVKNAAGQQRVLNALALAINSAAVGVNGLDAGVLAASTWYSIWVIYNPTTQVAAGLLSLSATAPTMPAGFTHRARIGWIRTDGTANKHPLPFSQFGDCVTYSPNTSANLTAVPHILLNGAATALTSVSLSLVVPPTVRKAILAGIASGTTSTQANVYRNANFNSAHLASFTANGVTTSREQFVVIGDSYNNPIHYYVISPGALSIVALGWEDNL